MPHLAFTMAMVLGMSCIIHGATTGRAGLIVFSLICMVVSGAILGRRT